MSLVEDLGARLRATAEELPVELVGLAVDRLHRATEQLQWVRQSSPSPLAVPELTGATEHVEHAAYALGVARELLAGYAVAALGLAGPAGPGPGAAARRGPAGDVADRPVEPAPPREEEPAGWWVRRVDELTGREPERTAARGGSGPATGEELWRAVADRVRGGDRDGLREALRSSAPPVGLSLGGLAAPVAGRAAARLLGRPPRPEDLPRIRREAAGEVRALLPGLPDGVLDALLARACRVAAPGGAQAQPAHPADSAVGAAVLAAVLRRRAGGDDSGDPTPGAAPPAGGDRRPDPPHPTRRPDPPHPARRPDTASPPRGPDRAPWRGPWGGPPAGGGARTEPGRSGRA